jgi:hypothetical protein
MEDAIEPVQEIKKKRGRKKKNTENEQNITISIEETPFESGLQNKSESTVKKRGRKPKGGKIVLKQPNIISADLPIANVILHLKCSIHDLNEYNNTKIQILTDPLVYNPVIPPAIMTYNSNVENTFSNYESELKNSDNNAYSEPEINKVSNLCQSCNSKCTNPVSNDTEIFEEDDSDVNIKDINQKLKKIKLQLYKNTNPDKKSACFWCTYEYDNPSCYIPKYEMDNQLYGYGSFCRPECAVAFLMKENLDDSTKFERYHLLNQMYSKIYNYKKNIKPSPNPYFLLDKFYGNLSIQEYRKLLKSEHMLLVIEKPMTRILPELHEDNDDFIMNIYGTASTTQSNQGVYKVKRQSEKQKGPSKKSIMKESFGIA